MSIIQKLRTRALELRKSRSPIAASITFAISEIEKIGKNNGNRETTDDEAIRVVQKIVATINENLAHADTDRAVHLNYEKTVLESVLPQMVTDEEIKSFLKSKYAFEEFAGVIFKKGEIMKVLREEFGSLVDMKRAGQIVSEIYGV